MRHTDPITNHFRLTPPQRAALKKLGINTVEDMLYHFPVRYGDTSETRSIGSLAAGDTAVVFGKISKLKTSKGFRSKIPMADGWVTDESGRIHCVWFNQPYLAKMTTDGALVRIEGKISQRRKKAAGAPPPTDLMVQGKLSESSDSGSDDSSGGASSVGTGGGELYFSNPKIEIVNSLPTGVGESLFKGTGDEADTQAHNLYPVYPESRGITSNWMYHALVKIFRSGILEGAAGTTGISDPLPAEILTKYNLPNIRTALIWIHTPMKQSDADAARKRFAFEEVFFIQLERQIARKEYEKNPAFVINVDAMVGAGASSVGSTANNSTARKGLEAFIKRFPFEATAAQRGAIDAIITDFAKGHAMSRLLEGDVGSGKTAVAASTAYTVVTTPPAGRKFGNLQVAYMCPTEILATQHFESFIQYFAYLGVQVGLITGSGCRKFPSKLNPKGWTDISRTQLLKWVESGDVPILIGTHALIQKSVKFKNLAYVIIDEQHRFGLRQRASLVQKDSDGLARAPHLLSMTATPIPRTLALTLYGDLDLTLLDQMPHGRKPIITEIVSPSPEARNAVYEKIRAELVSGRQAYVICPRIDEPDPTKEAAINAKSVTEEAKRLKARVFKEYTIGILHSKMKPDEKERVMLEFKAKKIDILCATSVIEVGVNVPNATVIVIEGAERFGLAQLHQLRGRVIRSNDQAYCYVFTDTKSEKTAERLTALQTAKNGFELAEYDLKFRGAGELSGGKQWGVSDIAMDALKNLKMVEAARTEATALVVQDLTLTRHPTLRAELIRRKKHMVHLE